MAKLHFDKDVARRNYKETRRAVDWRPLKITPKMLKEIISLYPVTNNSDIAEKVGIGISQVSAIIHMLKERGVILQKAHKARKYLNFDEAFKKLHLP